MEDSETTALNQCCNICVNNDKVLELMHKDIFFITYAVHWWCNWLNIWIQRMKSVFFFFNSFLACLYLKMLYLGWLWKSYFLVLFIQYYLSSSALFFHAPNKTVASTKYKSRRLFTRTESAHCGIPGKKKLAKTIELANTGGNLVHLFNKLRIEGTDK